MRTVFTTGQIAKIAKVAPRTVSKWFDSGRLEGYRIPGSQDRRVPRESLIKFLKESGMPQWQELADEQTARILTIGLEPAFREHLTVLPEDKLEFVHVGSLFEAGTVIGSSSVPPKVVVIDCMIGTGQVCDGIRHVKNHKSMTDSSLIVIACEDSGLVTFEGANDVFRRPVEVNVLEAQLKRFAQPKAA